MRIPCCSFDTQPLIKIVILALGSEKKMKLKWKKMKSCPSTGGKKSGRNVPSQVPMSAINKVIGQSH